MINEKSRSLLEEEVWKKKQDREREEESSKVRNLEALSSSMCDTETTCHVVIAYRLSVVREKMYVGRRITDESRIS